MTLARRPGLALAVLCLGTFAVLLDSTVVSVALPSLITGLHASLDQALARELAGLAHDVFASAYITAMHAALAVSVALLIAGALGCLLLRRAGGPAPAPAVAGRPATQQAHS